MPKNTYVPYTKKVIITENKAPTDKSIRLLNEFEEKARKNIIHKIHIEENYLNAVAIYYQEDIFKRVSYHIKFTLNGETIVITGDLDKHKWVRDFAELDLMFGKQEIYKEIHKKLSKIIADHLMRQCPEFVNNMAKG